MTEPVEAAVDAELVREHPGLRVRWVTVDASPGATPAGVRERLDVAASRLRGAEAVALRSRPVPRAYRVFFRHVGLDPDVDRPPAERLVVDRLVRGGLATGRSVEDAVALAVAETAVAVFAFDADALRGAVRVRVAGDREALGAGAHAHDLAPGSIVLADDRGPVAVLFGHSSPQHAVARGTRRICLVAVLVSGVPQAHADEALWLAAGALTTDL